jgi:integrase
MGTVHSFPGCVPDGPLKAAILRSFERLYHGKRQSTVRSDKVAVGHWFKWYGYQLPNECAVLRYIDYAREELDHSNKTIKASLMRLRRGFEPLGYYQYFDDAVRRVKTSHVPERREIKLIGFDKLRELIFVPDPSSPRGVRDRCMMALLIGGGLRISEALGLSIGDMRYTIAGTLYARLGMTKAGTPALQAFSPNAVPIIEQYLEMRQKESEQDAPLLTAYTPALAPSDRPLLRRNATRDFYGYANKIGIKASPHSCRATAITKLLADGVPHREVQEFSRHSSVQMVEIYDKRRWDVDSSTARLLKI